MTSRLFISGLLGVLLVTLGVAVWIGYAPDPITPPPAPVAPPIQPSSGLHPAEPTQKVSSSTPIDTPAPAERDTPDAQVLRERIAERRSARTR
jgi:hypothetical protein